MKSSHFTVLMAVMFFAAFAGKAHAQGSVTLNGTTQYVTMGGGTANPSVNTALDASVFTLECWFNWGGGGTGGSTGGAGIATMIPLIAKGAGEGEGTNVDANYIFGISGGRLAADFEQVGVLGVCVGGTNPGTACATAAVCTGGGTCSVVGTQNAPGLNRPVCGSVTITSGVWHHAAAVYDGACWHLYLDGVEDTGLNSACVTGASDWAACPQHSTTATGIDNAVSAAPRSDNIQHFGIGAMLNSTGVATAGGFFPGSIDEVRVWNVARTSSEISTNKNMPLITGAGLTGRWGLNERGGLDALDSAGATRQVGTLTPATSTFVATGAPLLFTAGGEVTVSFQQGTSGYTTAVDTTLLQASPTSDPTPLILATDLQNPSDARHGLIRFNNILGAGTGQIPAGAAIHSASLTLNVSDVTVAPASNFHRMIVDWAPAATWNSMVAGIQTGTEAATTPDATPENLLTLGRHNIDLTAGVVAWQGGASNYGWAWLPGSTNGAQVTSSDGTLADRPNLVVTYITNPNLPPNAPTVVMPLNGANGVSTSPTLTVNVTDPESEPMTVTFFGRESNAEMEDFTIVVLPDTQLYSESFPDLYLAQLEWIRDNRVARNIVFVTQLGDCVDNQDDPGQEFQWTNASAAWDLIEAPNAEVPYGIAVGNHDNGGNARTGANEGATTIQYTKHFGLQRVCPGTCSNNVSITCEKDADCVSPGICNPGSSCKSWFGGRYDFGDPVTYFRNTDNHYELFSAGGMDFIAFHLEWDCADGSMGCVSPGVPHATRAATNAWMDNILTNVHPDRRAMISSHHLIQPTGSPPAFSNQGQAVYDVVKDNPNVFMTLCGHLDQANRRTDTFGGGTIHSMVSDYQTRPQGGRGWMRTMTFSPSTNNIHVETFSPWVNYPATPKVLQSINSHGDNTAGTPQNEFDLAYSMVPSFVQIGSPQTGVASGSNASVVWSGLNTDALHEWYVTVNDGTTTITGPTWTFTTTCSSDAACNDNNPCTDDVCNIGSGTCQNTNDNSNPCTDGTACTVGDACVSGACVPGTPTTCTSPATCNPSTGLCQMPPQTVTFQQGVSGYTGAVDTFINAGTAGADNSAAAALTVDLAPNVQQALIKFGGVFVSEGGPIPSGSTISSATVTVNATTTTVQQIGFHRMKQAWVATNNWTTFGLTPWNATPGIQIGDALESEAGADGSMTMPATGLNTVTVTTGVQAWAANPATHFGWVLNQTVDDSVTFESAEAATPTNRPKLSVTFIPPLPCTVNSECDDDDACNGVETCNTGTALCEDGTPLNCNDSNPCTTDSCIPASGCQNVNNTNSCDDGDACTSSDVCSGGTCDGTPIPNCCTTVAQCDDGEDCTTDSCQPANTAAISLNGSGQYVNLGNGSAVTNFNTGSFTLEGWFRAAATPTSAVSLIRMGRSGNFPVAVVQIVANTNTITANVETNTSPTQADSGTATFTLNTWTHFAAVADRTVGAQRLRLYVNGVLASDVDASVWGTNPISTTDQTVLGANRDAAGVVAALYNGALDEIRIWNTARTAQQILDNKNVQLTSSTGLIARWGLNDGSGTTATDSVGTNHGALVGGASWITSGLVNMGSSSCVYTPIANCCEVAADCDDSNECTDDDCVANSCVYVNNSDFCDDNSACTSGDVCSGGTCAGTTINCDDSEVCTTDSCVPATGCQYATNSLPCSDGDPCTDSDICSGGSCQAGSPIPNCCDTAADCNDGLDCTTDTCPSGNLGGLNFDGTNDVVTTAGFAPGLGSATFTLEVWVRRDGASWGTTTNAAPLSGAGGLQNVVTLIAKGRSEADATTQDCNYFFGIDPTNGRLVADFEQLSAGPGPWLAGLNHPMCSSAMITDQNWHHVAVTYDKAAGKGWKFYIDGADVTAANGSPATCGAVSLCTDLTACVQNPGVDPRFDSIQRFGLGAALDSTAGGNPGGYFGGMMDEVRVWNVARTQAQIQSDKDREIASATNLVGRWGMNHSSGTVATDSATPAEDGTLTNFPASPWITNPAQLPSFNNCQHTPVASGTPCGSSGNTDCDNPDICNGSGECQPNQEPNGTACTADGLECTNDVCNAGTCTHPNSASGTACGSSADTDCSDPDTCDGAGACQVNNQSNGTSCDDGLFCNGVDTCTGGNCSTHSGDPCSGGMDCANSCNEAADNCFDAVGTLCTDDGNECTDNECDGAGICASNDNTDVCDDGDPCTEDDVCTNGDCMGTAIVGCLECTVPADCDDGNDCTDDACVLSVCLHTPTAAGTACTDDGNVCTDNECNGAGVCAALNNTDPCTDGLFCNGLDTCSGGTCSVHAGDPCTGGSECANACNETADNCFDATGTACTDDGNVCTDNECNGAGVCAPLNNTDPCTDGLFCNGLDTCSGGTCSVHAGDPCAGGSECANACNETADNCFDATGTACTDDGNVCTDNECNGAGVCAPLNNTDPCTDGLFCNGLDTCSGGTCSVHAGDPCAGGSECANACNETADNCFDATGTACTDDGNVCTDNECNGAGVCAPLNNTDPCTDGLFCNGLDTCSGGTCSVHAGDPCAGGSECANACNETADNCFDATGTACTDDGNVCTDNECNGAGVCAPLNNTDPCTDGLFCNGLDTCSGGTCSVHAGDPCAGGSECANACNETADNCFDATGTACTDDGNVCTDNECNGAGVCAPLNNTDPCTDGLFCNGLDTCSGGTCSVHAGDPCAGGSECANACNETADNCFDATGTACTDDGNVCTDNECNGAGVCAPLNNTDPCTDGLFCNGLDTCSGGTCSVHAGDPCAGGSECANACNETADNCFDATGTACTDDGNVCTDNECNGAGVCAPLNNTDPCDDNDACTTNDVCNAGSCVGGIPPNCDDQNVCTADSCDVDTGCGHDPVPNGTECDDGVFCNGTNTCQGGSCVLGPPNCDNSCETCDEDGNTCDWCILDVDHNGGMGTGDFSFFAGCFGSCYPAQHTCAMANFDGDPNNCAGTGDFAGFAGCFGLTCSQCANCDGGLMVAARPIAEAVRPLTIQLVVLSEPSVLDSSQVLPVSRQAVSVGALFVIEMWVHQGSLPASESGLAAVYADFAFDNQMVLIESVEGSDAFPLFPSSSFAGRGFVQSVGGCADVGGGLHRGAEWVRAATLHARGFAPGTAVLDVGPAREPLGISIISRFGDVETDRLRFVGARVRLQGARASEKTDRAIQGSSR